MAKCKTVVHVIFKRTLGDIIGGCPRKATFKDMDHFVVKQDGALVVEWGRDKYIYPAHKIARIKLSRPE